VFYPLLIDLLDRRVLVVGGGVVAERKVVSLLEAGAAVTVVAPETTPHLQTLADSKSLRLHRRNFEEADIEGMLLIVSATDDRRTQEHVAKLARDRGILINTVDRPALCDFIVPAIVRRGDVIVAISTSGKSPTLAAALRERVETVITPDAGRVAQLLGQIRVAVHERFSDADSRKAVFERIVASGILDWISQCDDQEALKRIHGMLESGQ
jgi:precorrin-2 dehydrogenase/sirohydrochlorin ferrochelatase